MDNSSNSNENYDLGYHPSPSSVNQIDRSITETTGYSTLSGDSFAYCRTSSETSAFSDPTDENIYSDEPSPLGWPITKSVTRNQAVLSRLGMKQHSNVVDKKSDDQEAVDPGELV